MYDLTASLYPPDPLAELARGVLADLYRAVCGRHPKAVRAYHDADALLLLLRFDPADVADVGGGFEHLLEGTFDAMPGMIASALEARSGHRLEPGDLSVCIERGLAVFAFSPLGAGDPAPADPFCLDDALASAANARPGLRAAR